MHLQRGQQPQYPAHPHSKRPQKYSGENDIEDCIDVSVPSNRTFSAHSIKGKGRGIVPLPATPPHIRTKSQQPKAEPQRPSKWRAPLCIYSSKSADQHHASIQVALQAKSRVEKGSNKACIRTGLPLSVPWHDASPSLAPPHVESITATTAPALEAEETAADRAKWVQKCKNAREPETEANVVRISRVQVAGDVTVPERRAPVARMY